MPEDSGSEHYELSQDDALFLWDLAHIVVSRTDEEHDACQTYG